MKRKITTMTVILASVGMASIAAAAPGAPKPQDPTRTTATTTKVPFDGKVLEQQVLLDRAGFSPGVIDGKSGWTLTAAIKGFQSARGLAPTGTLDTATVQALTGGTAVPGTVTIALTPEMLAGPFAAKIPKQEDAQAKLPGLYYRSPLEKLAERFHTTPDTLVKLNSPMTKLDPGTRVVFPNVQPGSTAYPQELPADWRVTLAGLNVAAPTTSAVKLVVSKKDRMLRAYDEAGKLIAQFPVTTGSQHDPLPLGTWKIEGLSYNPKFHFNPALFWDAKPGEKKAMLPPGPNGPVGVIWMNLSKQHYGIHGTPEPQNIGRTQSHGCIRMTNWDAARLSLMVKAGTPAIFEA